MYDDSRFWAKRSAVSLFVAVAAICLAANLSWAGTPNIKVYKQVVCWTNICEAFSTNLTSQKTALGARVDPAECPAFCYRIIVTNISDVMLTNVSVTDDHLDLSACFPAPFVLTPGGQPNSSATCIFSTVRHCDSTTNIVTAQGTGVVVDSQTQTVTSTDTNLVFIVPISVACSLLVSTNGGGSFITPDANGVAEVLVGNIYLVRVVVTNTGSYALQNIRLLSTGGTPLCFASTNIGSLAIGASVTVDCPNHLCASAGPTNTFAVSVSAEASQAAGHVCAYNTNGSLITASSQCSGSVACVGPPQICVTKQIACYLGANQCGAFGPVALGVASLEREPVFCYSITVSNCGPVGLTNISVVDDIYGTLTGDFSCAAGVLAAGGSCSHVFTAEVPLGPNGTINLVTNTVSATAQSVFNGQPTTASSSAVAVVIPASVACAKQYTIDGGPLTNDVIISDHKPHTVVWYVTVTNSGLANLDMVQVTDLTANLGCAISLPAFRLDAGASATFAICTNAAFVCASGVINDVQVTATQFSYSTNRVPLCNVARIGMADTNITAQSQGTATLLCGKATACRVTGGGRQDLSDPNGSLCPADAQYATHGGQVGAPLSGNLCLIDTSLPNYWLGNPAIRGNWTHVRHAQGGVEGNFQARFFDTLVCACLDSDLNPSTCQYGLRPVVNGFCNSRDPCAGPGPRRAPGNKIAFTGVGDWTCDAGRRATRACLFRVDIEDRGEPGNAHALGVGSKPCSLPDRYRLRIWVLTEQELSQLNGAGPDPYLIHFRDCISACNGINSQDGVCGPNACSGSDCDGSGTTGTITFPGGCPVRGPNVDDGGELLQGNYQIHPANF
jgi:hypothetical protein